MANRAENIYYNFIMDILALQELSENEVLT